jgi:hypothetical protein
MVVSCEGSDFELTLPKPVTRADTTIVIGGVSNTRSGYIRVDFRGKTLTGDTFAAPTHILVRGPKAGEMNFVGDFSYYWGRRGPSVHMSYPIPEGVTAEWFYNEVRVPEGLDPQGSYFMANGFGEGYFGMQVNSPTERRILFSVWSPFQTDDPKAIPEEDRVKLLRKGEHTVVNDFGNEGSGGQSFLRYNWQAGKTYLFLNRVRPIEGGYTEYTAWFRSPDEPGWILIARWKRPKTQTYYTRPHSFLENFNPVQGYITRKGCYSNQWIRTAAGEWIELTKGRFTVDATGGPGWRMDYKGGADTDGFFLQNCGFFDDRTAAGSLFERTPTHRRPEIELSELD